MGLSSSSVFAARFTSPSYEVNGNIGDSISGAQSSSSYNLVSSGGESISGDTSSSSYKLGGGFTATLAESIKLTVDQSSLTFSSFVPGTPQTKQLDISVQTDTAGYNLSALQNNNLTSGSYSIPAVSGSIASPVAWSDGTTKGLGFTVVSASATPPAGSWNSGSSYAAFPSSATTFYNRTGYSGGATDTVTARVKLDVAASQEAATYANQVTITGTTTP